MKAVAAIVVAVMLAGCSTTAKLLDYTEQKIAPAGTVVVRSQSLIELSEEFRLSYLEFRDVIGGKRNSISESDFNILLEADRELSGLGAYVMACCRQGTPWATYC